MKYPLLTYTWLGLFIVNTASSVQALDNVDILVLYTAGVSEHYSGQQEVRFEHLINVTNQVYLDSGVNMSLRIVGSHEVDYPDTGDSGDALDAMTNGEGDFADIETMRTSLGADLVILYRPYKISHNSCGVAWVTGVKTNGYFGSNWDDYGYSHSAINTCADYTTTHEIGHNSGLTHSRAQNSNTGTFHYSMGHGVEGLFTTIMAYQSAYNVGYLSGKIYKFSNPELDCRGEPCGVDRNDYVLGADATHSLNLSIPQIKEWREEVIPQDIVALVQHRLELLNAAEALLIETKADWTTAHNEQASKLAHYQAIEGRHQDKLEAWWYEAFKEQDLYKRLSEATQRYEENPSQSNSDLKQDAINAAMEQRQRVEEIIELATPILTPLLALTEASHQLREHEALVKNAEEAVTAASNAYQTALNQLNALQP